VVVPFLFFFFLLSRFSLAASRFFHLEWRSEMAEFSLSIWFSV
jgi:hypothetical protein